MNSPVIDWLLDSDPAIRWQVMRDLTDEPDAAAAVDVVRERRHQNGRRLLD